MRANPMFFAILLLLSAPLGLSQSEPPSGRQFLEAELSLANSSGLYYIVDVGEGKIELKAKGVSLRSWKIEKIRLWGDPVLTYPVALLKKSALFPPKREEIKPSRTSEEDSFELEALELRDMPSIYALSLENNITVYIRPKSEGWTSFLRKIGPALRWYLYPPLKTLWTKARKNSFTAFDITFESKDDSKSFYWAIGENAPFIILLSVRARSRSDNYPDQRR